MTAEALKTITRPMKIRRSVTVKSHRSTLTRLAMRDVSFHHGDAESTGRNSMDFVEDVTTLVQCRCRRGDTEAHRNRQSSVSLWLISELRLWCRRGSGQPL